LASTYPLLKCSKCGAKILQYPGARFTNCQICGFRTYFEVQPMPTTQMSPATSYPTETAKPTGKTSAEKKTWTIADFETLRREAEELQETESGRIEVSHLSDVFSNTDALATLLALYYSAWRAGSLEKELYDLILAAVNEPGTVRDAEKYSMAWLIRRILAKEAISSNSQDATKEQSEGASVVSEEGEEDEKNLHMLGTSENLAYQAKSVTIAEQQTGSKISDLQGYNEILRLYSKDFVISYTEATDSMIVSAKKILSHKELAERTKHMFWGNVIHAELDKAIRILGFNYTVGAYLSGRFVADERARWNPDLTGIYYVMTQEYYRTKTLIPRSAWHYEDIEQKIVVEGTQASNDNQAKMNYPPEGETAPVLDDEWVCPKHGKIGVVQGGGLLEKALSLQSILQSHRTQYHCEETLRRVSLTPEQVQRGEAEIAEERRQKRARLEEFWDIDKALGKTTWYNFMWKKPMKRDLEKLRKEALGEK